MLLGLSAAACGLFDFDSPGGVAAFSNAAGDGGDRSGASEQGGSASVLDPGEASGSGGKPDGAGESGASSGLAGGGAKNDTASGGAGGEEQGASSAVHGKVIDRFGAPAPNATVQIGDAQAVTDDEGAFTIPDVSPTYELSMLVQGDGWVFQDLTRRDPTLQVYIGRPARFTYCDATLKHFTLGQNEQLSLAIGTDSGATERANVVSDVSFAYKWEGATSVDGAIHALQWLKDPASFLPVSYKAFFSKPISLSKDADSKVELDMTPAAITSAAISGSAVPKAKAERNNRAFVQFQSGASVTVVDDAPSRDAFDYVVPQLANSHITLMAAVGPYDGPRGVVHKDGLSPGATGISLDVPLPPTVLKPADGAEGVDTSTPFTFTGSEDNAGAFVAYIHRPTGERPKIYVVTTRRTFTLPSIVGGAVTLSSKQTYEWWVETHGAFSTVDEMTGPEGFIDEFGFHGDLPNGGHATDGSFTYSNTHQFSAK